MFVWNLKPRIKRVALLVCCIISKRRGESLWKGGSFYIERQSSRRKSRRSSRWPKFSAGHFKGSTCPRVTGQLNNNSTNCISAFSICVFLLWRLFCGAEFNSTIQLYFYFSDTSLPVILGVTDQIPLLESHCPSIFLPQIWFEHCSMNKLYF